MSRNNKNARNLERARSIAKMHLDGNKGPAKTNPLHGKRWGYRNNPEVLKRQAEMLKVTHESNKTSGKKILEKAGGASREQGN